MTSVEVAAILHRLGAAYRSEVTPALAEVWADHLEPLDWLLARDAADRLIASDDGFFPTVARFREAYNAERRARASRQPALPAEKSERVSPDTFRAGLAEARASLYRRRQP